MDGLTGIASGVDTAAIVDKLMELERQPRTRMDWRKQQLTTVGSDLGTVQSKLLALRSAAAGMRDVGTWADVQSLDSSDPRVVVERASGAGPGGYTINVLGLARAEQRSYDFAPPAAATTIDFGTAQVALNAGATIDDAVSAINTDATAPVYAADVNGRLVLSARTTGTASAFSATSSALSNQQVTPGVDATYTVDGGPVQTSSSNVVLNAVPGLKLTFKGVTATPASVTVGVAGVDTTLVKTKVKAFVDAYNDFVTTTRGMLAEARVANPANADDAAKGVLGGDFGLTTILSRFRQAASDPLAGVSTAMDELREIGVSTGAPTGGQSSDASKAGLLVLDDATLDNALAADPLSVRRLVGGIAGTPGIAQRFEDEVKTLVGPGKLIDSRISANDDALKSLQKQMTDEDARLAARQARLKAQFAAMESALNASQTQQAWLSGQLAQLG